MRNNNIVRKERDKFKKKQELKELKLEKRAFKIKKDGKQTKFKI